jgi:hypothetical protein
MIKFVIYCTKAIVVAIVALLLTSCRYNVDLGDGIDGSGNVITEKRTITESFTKIEVNRGIEVIVEQANAVEVEVEADDNIIKHITTVVENGVLKITSDEDIDSAETETVRVKMPTITSLDATSGSSISSKNTLKGTNLNVNSDSGSEIKLTLEYGSVSSDSSSGSEITLAGKAIKLKTNCSSGSQINADNLIANDIQSESSSGSSTSVQPLVNLDATANSGGSIDYKGTPKNVKATENSGGSVSKN